MSADEGRLDPTVVAALFVEHEEELKRFLIGVLRDPQLANDVLQTTFAKLIEQGHQTEEAARKAWLFRVAYNEALAIRRRQGAGKRIIERVSWHRPTESDAADKPLVRFEDVETVRIAIGKLPPEQRELVRLRIYEELTFAQIADRLDIPLGTALWRMRAALKKLKTELKESD